MSDLDQYDFELPRELIAQRALSRRSDARLMVVSRRAATIVHAHVRDLPDFLARHDCLVLNDTRVVAARLVGYRAVSGGRWSGLFLGADQAGNWQVLCKTRGHLRVGET
ncbi:MAG: S-adenosylmethionine:tRNA ribosyltransferase-isomerase, partial [Planctomycetes bacterium]|nr:S-adenosylmethionine:tRNA ribosyltransferase-isomerase [Planctomycetota bacterium]